MADNDHTEFPKSVRIGPIIFSVEFVTGLESDTRERLDGWIQYNRCKISIEESLVDQRKRAVFWHEVVHGLADSAGVKLKESEVERLGNALWLFIIENSGALRW